jgi:diguanylate cyclase (GGDEF)-like protein
MNAPPENAWIDSLLAAARERVARAGYQVTVHCRQDDATDDATIRQPCCHANTLFCGDDFAAHLPDLFDRLTADGRPTLFRCPAGLLGFALALRLSPGQHHVLVASGMREQSLDLFSIERVATAGGSDPFALLEQLQALPVTSEQEARELAEQVYAMTMARISPATPALSGQDTLDQLKLVTAISGSFDLSMTDREVFALLQETIGLMFDVPATVAAIPNRTNGQFTLACGWGAEPDGGTIPASQVTRVFPADVSYRLVLREDALRELLPRTQARLATCQSLVYGADLLGVICALDKEFGPEETLFVDLLTGRATQRLALLHQEQEFARKSTLSRRLLAMITTLGGVEGQELYDHILQMASELADASSGSLMLLNEEEEVLQIRSSIGMSPQLMKAMSVRLGTGIAGRVAQSGTPLLVNDIEKDERVCSPNRPRFKTKSFISLPLVSRVRVSGVLNLSDKRNHGIFTDADLELLTPFVSHITAMMQKNVVQEQVAMLERLSITDPLTELYNRRFLERRMEEEINRSMRNGSVLTIMMIDLDYFKAYNDLCGHVAGDMALKKVAQVLSAAVRDMDVVTRYGGEEFCVLLPATAKRESLRVADRIRKDIEHELFPGEEKLPFGRLTTSIGISSFPGDGVTSIAIINAADIALYEAKSAGRNRIMLYADGGSGAPPKHVTVPLLT